MTHNPFTLEGKSILVTGAASGIGKATALLCSQLGANVCITDINEDGLKQTLELLNPLASNILFVSDLTKDDSIASLAADLPQLDGVASVAGVPMMSPVQFYKSADIQKVFCINTWAPVFLLKELIKKRKLSKQSSVVFVASLAGVKHYTVGNGIYGMSKSALDTFMHFAAVELAHKGIRCNCVNPAMVETPLAKQVNTTDESRIADINKYPLKRYGTPQDVANGIAFLLSDAAAWMTGHSLIIDGGRSLV